MPDDTAIIGHDDRALAFSVAAADLVLELEDGSTVSLASGGARPIFARDADALIGCDFPALFADEDRPRIDAMIRRAEEVMRPDPETLRVAATGAIVLCGICVLPGDVRRVFVALTRPRLPGQTPMAAAGRDPKTGALPREQFIGAARDLVFGTQELGVRATLTLVRFPAADVGADALERIIGRLRAISLGDAVGQIATDMLAIVHGGTACPDSIAAAFSPETDDVAVREIDLKPDGLSIQDVANVIAYAMAKFQEHGPAEFDIASLSSGMKRLVRETVNRLSVLRQVVISKAFRIVFQPIVTLATSEVHHYEVLSRFPGGDEPHRTVAFAESIGLIEDLDLAVCRKASDIVRETAAAGAEVSLAINVSARSLRSDALVMAFDRLLADLGPNRSRIMLEITETDRIEDLTAAEKVLQHFRRAGNPVCLDDFGAGASSFQYFQALTVDYAKIDGAYVHDVLTSRRDAAILRAMVSLCSELGVRTVAEMVEREDQAVRLRGLGVDFGQGWLFGKPKLTIPLDNH